MTWMRPRERHDKGRREREKAERALADTEALWPEVRDLAENMRDLRRRNQFAEQLRFAMRREA